MIVGAPWTLVGAFLDKAKSVPEGAAFRAKERGIWRTWTYRMAAEETGRFAVGLSKMGVSRGDTVAIIGPNTPRLYMAILGCQATGAVPVVCHLDVTPGEIAFHQAFRRLRLVVSNDLAGSGALTNAIGDKSELLGAVVLETDGWQQSDADTSIAYDAVLEDGAREIDSLDDWLQEAVATLSDTDLALKSFSAGSDGPAREVSLNHAMIRRAVDIISPLKVFCEGENVLAFLPMSHYADQLQFFCAIASGTTLNTPESTVTVFADIRDISPTVLVATPPIYAKFRALHEDRISLASRPIQSVVSSVLARAARAAAGESRQSFLGPIQRWLLINPIRRQMGFGSVKVAISTQTPLPNHMQSFFGALGVTFVNLYGKAEFAGALAISDGGSFPAENPSLAIGDDGRLVALVDDRAASCLPGHAGPADQAVEAQAAVETGDVATCANGTWSVAGRLSSQLNLEDGTSFQPEPIEQRLTDTPFIRAVVLFGQKRQELTAVVLPAMDRLSLWARQEGISFANAKELLKDAKTEDLFQTLISELNSELEAASDCVRIHQFLVLPDSAAYLSRHGGVQRPKLAGLAPNIASLTHVVS